VKRARLVLVLLVVVAALGATAAVFALRRPFPSDHTPEGAYMRIARSVTEDRVRDAFPYMETDAQWAAYTIGDMRAKASALIERGYPEPERGQLLAAYRDEARAPDGADVFAVVARRRGWIARLRKDLSGAVRTEIRGERATIVTARGTRYPFRLRDNGIWGMTIFTAELAAEAERATRDLAVVTAAAADYQRGRRDDGAAWFDGGVFDGGVFDGGVPLVDGGARAPSLAIDAGPSRAP